MRRAIIATAGTAAALVALLSYKSSNALKVSKVAVTPGSSVTTLAPSSTSSSTSTTAGSSSSSPSTSSGSSSSSSATSTTTTPPSSTAAGPKAVTGTDVQYNYGEIQLQVTTTAGKITNIDIVKESAPDGRSQSINSQALPILVREAIAAQGVNIDVVSGATFTSQAFAQALQSALSDTDK